MLYRRHTSSGHPKTIRSLNPSDDPSGIRLISKKFSPDEEVNEVVKSIKSSRCRITKTQRLQY